MREETGIATAALLRLDAVGAIDVEHFRERHAWDPALTQIQEYAFGASVDGWEISLSPEHVEFVWSTFEDALARLSWESNRIALRELNGRLSATRGPDIPLFEP